MWLFSPFFFQFSMLRLQLLKNALAEHSGGSTGVLQLYVNECIPWGSADVLQLQVNECIPWGSTGVLRLMLMNATFLSSHGACCSKRFGNFGQNLLAVLKAVVFLFSLLFAKIILPKYKYIIFFNEFVIILILLQDRRRRRF